MTGSEQNYHRLYTQELRKYLSPNYFNPVPSRLLWLIPHTIIITILTVGIVFGGFNILLKLVMALFIGHSFACFGFLGHEILHGSVVKTHWLRDLLAGICLAPFCVGPALWRWWHNVEHHGHTQYQGDDPDAYSTFEDYKKRIGLQILQKIAPMGSILFFPFFCFWFTLHNFQMYCKFLTKHQGGKRLMVTLQYFVPTLFWLILGVKFGLVPWIFFYLIPLLIANFIIISYIATNHLLNPLLDVDDPIAGSLTVKTWRIIDIFHLNFSYHTEHHIFPAMNPKYAPQVKELLKQFWPEKYNEMSHAKALHTLWRTPRLYLDESHLIDPPTQNVFDTLPLLNPDDIRPIRKTSAS